MNNDVDISNSTAESIEETGKPGSEGSSDVALEAKAPNIDPLLGHKKKNKL